MNDRQGQAAKRVGDAEDSRRRRRMRRLRRRRHRRLPPVALIPTMCTLGNLVAGFAAIHYAARPMELVGLWNWTGLTLASVLVFIGMLFDALDGSIARMTKSTSELGAQLDSFADLVTFGVAPAFMTIMLVGLYVTDGSEVVIIGPEADSIFGRFIWGIAAAYACCAALRLARFNVETQSRSTYDHLIFRGLPSPGAAGAVVSLILLHQHLEANFEEVTQAFVRSAAFILPFIMILCAFGMVSSLPYPHVINRYMRGRRSFRYVVTLLIPVLIVIWSFQWLLAIAFCTYALSAPVQQTWRWFRKRAASARAS